MLRSVLRPPQLAASLFWSALQRMSAIGTKRTSRIAPHMSFSGVKRTCLFALHMSAYDPKRTSSLLAPPAKPV